MGEPAGIGGEILLKAWVQRTDAGPVFFAIDSPARLARTAARFGIACPVVPIAGPADAAKAFARGLPVLDLAVDLDAVELGRPAPATGWAVIAAIDRAVDLVRAGLAAGLVTNPIHKATVQGAGFAYPGHTEYLGYL